MRETDSVVSTISDSRATVETSSSSNDERKRGGQRSFSSPYAAATLDEIPTPILNLLIVLGPYTRHFRKLCQVIAWEKAYSRQSTLLVLLWIVVCLWTNQLLTFGLPPLIAYKVCNDWVNVRTSKVRREKLERKRLAQQRQCEKREKDKNDTDDDDEDDDHYYDNDDSERFRQQKSKQYQEEEEDLVSRKFQSHDHVSLDDTLHDLAIINDYVDRFRYKLRWLADRLNGSRPENLTVVLSILVFVWPSWLILNWLLGTRGVLAIAGSCLLVSLSPWFEVIVTTVKRNALVTHITTAIWAYSTACVLFALFSLVPQRFLVGLVPVDRKPANQPKSWFSRLRDIARRNKAEAMNIIKKLQDEEEKQEQHQKSPGTRSEMIFQFEVYENQRWWLGMEWTNNTMPSERGPWTDVQLAPIASKEELQLPESSQRVEYKSAGSDGQPIKHIITKTWSWADGDWWVDMTGEMQGRVDRNGWEYGNNSWQQMSGQPGMQKFTRRRRWCRRAKLVERRVDEKI